MIHTGGAPNVGAGAKAASEEDMDGSIIGPYQFFRASWIQDIFHPAQLLTFAPHLQGVAQPGSTSRLWAGGSLRSAGKGNSGCSAAR